MSAGDKAKKPARPTSKRPAKPKPPSTKPQDVKPQGAKPAAEADSQRSVPAGAKKTATPTMPSTKSDNGSPTGTSNTSPPKAAQSPAASPKPAARSKAIPNSALALAAIVIGLGVGFLTYAFGSAADRTPTARIQMVLDEDQTGWPFYAAVQEEAVAQVDAAETQAAVRASLSQPDAAGDLWVDRPGDLSVFAIYATADSDEAAIEFASAAAQELQTRNVSQRQSGEASTLAELQSQLAELEARVAELSTTLDGADNETDGESVRVVAREELRIASADRADTERAIIDLETDIATIGPAFRPAAPAVIQSTGSRSILASIASAAAAAALTLLALSFVAPGRDDS